MLLDKRKRVYVSRRRHTGVQARLSTQTALHLGSSKKGLVKLFILSQCSLSILTRPFQDEWNPINSRSSHPYSAATIHTWHPNLASKFESCCRKIPSQERVGSQPRLSFNIHSDRCVQKTLCLGDDSASLL